MSARCSLSRIAATGVAIAVLGAVAVGHLSPGVSAAQIADEPIGVALRALLPSSARSYTVDAAGLARSGRRMASLEPLGVPDSARRRLVIVGGVDGAPDSTKATLDFLRWWFADAAAASLRNAWTVAAIPCALPDRCGATSAPADEAAPLATAFPPESGFFDDKQDPESRFLWRWTAMQAPDLVIDLRVAAATGWRANVLAMDVVTGAVAAPETSFVAALGAGRPSGLAPVAALQLDAPVADATRAIAGLLQNLPLASSPLRQAIDARLARTPLDVARLVAPKYPAQPIMSYIPALSWSGSLHLAQMTGEEKYWDKPLADLAPFLSGATPTIAEPYLLTSLAGHLALADLATMQDNAAAGDLARKGADFLLPESSAGIVRFPRGWTDDMFMATSVLARVAARTGDARYADAAGRLLTTYATRLQRPDGLFIHAAEGPHAWGRGNGFAAFGLMEALTHLPSTWSARASVLESYRKLMKALVAHQAPDGMWRQVVDEAGSYREFTVTAMVLTAMKRGVRLGWLDATYTPIVERAWKGLLARISEDGTFVDVCTGTGSGPTRQYYLDRAAVVGADDRGAAMALTAALEMAEN